MLTGGNINNINLKGLMLPAGEYAKITVRPKLGFLWGVSIGEAKRYFYTKWLSKSNYEALNMEYECHTERSIGNNPTIDLIFAIQKKESKCHMTRPIENHWRQIKWILLYN